MSDLRATKGRATLATSAARLGREPLAATTTRIPQTLASVNNEFSIVAALDRAFERNDLAAADRLLRAWRKTLGVR